MTRRSAPILLLVVTAIAILTLASCSRYDPMPKWTGYSIEVKK